MRRVRPPPIVIVGGAQHTAPWDHQSSATRFIREKRTVLLRHGMGCGKSRTVANALDEENCQRVLVTAPKSVLAVWTNQMSLWSPRQWRTCVLNDELGTVKDRVKHMRDLHATAGMPTMTQVNYEACWREPLDAALRTAHFDALVMDESQNIKAWKGAATNYVGSLARGIPLRIALSGTPTPHSPLDLFGQFRSINPNVFGWSWIQFRNRYAVIDSRGGFPKIVRFQHLDELAERIAPWTHVAERSLLKLTAATHNVISVRLSIPAQKCYDDLEDYLCSQVLDGTVSAPNRMVALLRLEQLTGGNVSLDPTDADCEREVRRVCDAKERALAELIDGLAPEEPMPVFARFTPDLQAIHRAAASAGVSSCELSGQRNELAAWQRGEAKIIAIQIKSGGTGIDLTRANHCAFYSIGFDGGAYEQALCRVHRPGQERPVSYYHFVAADTIDEVKYKSLGRKKDLADGLVEEVIQIRNSLPFGATAHGAA